MTRAIVSAPAKINLHLAVGGKRPDGYHDVVTVLQTLAFADEITIEPADRLALHCEPPLDIPAEDNLAWRAALAAAQAFGQDPRMAISLRKHIPEGAGLGGGSSDAAAVLAGCAALWGERLDDGRLVAAAAVLGADVPFFLTGGAALLAGRGDELVRALPALKSAVVLAAPKEPVATPAAYAAFDRIAHSRPPSPDPLVAALEGSDAAAVSRMLYNNLTEAAIAVTPSIAGVLIAMREAPGITAALLSGSGSAVFGLAEDEAAATRVAEELGERGWWSVATETTSGTRVRLEGAR